MGRRFFVCSVGEPGKGYDLENLQRIIEKKAFILHEDTKQKGTYNQIKPNDILILKYQNGLIAYGLAMGNYKADVDEWNLYSPVKGWVFHNNLNKEKGISSYGLQLKTIGGGQYGTVKEVTPKFGVDKMEEIESDSDLVKQIKSEIMENQHAEELQGIISILKHKKQIILQGPPGTGKTRMAKEVSLVAISDDFISDKEFSEFIYPDLTIQSLDSDESIRIISIVGDAVRVLIKSTEKNYPVYFREIRDRIKKGDWKDSEGKYKSDYMTLLALHVFETYRDKQVKLLQFHPAYSYDDFVRGIVADTTNGTVSYRSINKVFGELAARAWQNYQDSKKTPEQLSEEQKINQYIDLFRDYLEDEIESKGGKLFLEGTTTYLFQVDEDAVRYTGDNWKLITGQRLLFSDIKKLYLSGINTRQEIKASPSISGLAKHHSSYFLRVLNLFKDFVKVKTVSVPESNSVSEKNYILIIDEINRANLPSVLGELIYGLEYRGESVESMYEVDGSRSMVIPPNLYIIGTMNTADRSVGHIDYAIRRRFAFVNVHPSDQPIREVVKDLPTQAKALVLFQKVSNLFHQEYLNSDFKAQEVQLGHSYFLAENEALLKLKLEYEIKPLLKEYVKDGILNEKATAEIDKL